MYTDIGKHIL